MESEDYSRLSAEITELVTPEDLERFIERARALADGSEDPDLYALGEMAVMGQTANEALAAIPPPQREKRGK